MCCHGIKRSQQRPVCCRQVISVVLSVYITCLLSFYYAQWYECTWRRAEEQTATSAAGSRARAAGAAWSHGEASEMPMRVQLLQAAQAKFLMLKREKKKHFLLTDAVVKQSQTACLVILSRLKLYMKLTWIHRMVQVKNKTKQKTWILFDLSKNSWLEVLFLLKEGNLAFKITKNAVEIWHKGKKYFCIGLPYIFAALKRTFPVLFYPESQKPCHLELVKWLFCFLWPVLRKLAHSRRYK